MMDHAKAFLASHRALTVCAREFSRLSDDVVAAAKLFATNSLDEVPIVRRSPDRCIVQAGPVALTVAWLRKGSDSPADGELLAIVWRGAVAPRNSHSPERVGAFAAAGPPVAVWEQAYLPSAESEATWRWHSGGPRPHADDAGSTSTELATECVGQLRRAFEAVVTHARQ